MHDLPRTKKRKIALLSVSEGTPSLSLCDIPKLRFPTFYVILCIDATCAHLPMHARLYRDALYTLESDSSNTIHIPRACAHAPKVAPDIYGSLPFSHAKSALSHTPMLSLNCFGKALRAQTKITEKEQGIGEDHRPKVERVTFSARRLISTQTRDFKGE